MEILMAQKSRAAARQSSKVSKAKTGAKTSKVKTPAARRAVPPKLKADKTGKAAAKPAKMTPVKPAAPATTAVVEPRIEQAKAALTKASVSKSSTGKMSAKAGAKTRGRKITVEIGPNEAASALALKWSSLYKKAEQIEAKPYNMKAVFEEKTAIVHKLLGWGYILANRNDRLEVLFKDGIKYLISNYKP
jgi:hypothetical protein